MAVDQLNRDRQGGEHGLSRGVVTVKEDWVDLYYRGVVPGASCISLVNDNYLSFSLLRVKGDFNVGQQNKTTIAWVLQKKTIVLLW